MKQIEEAFGKLSGVQKILLSTDGSVTEILDVLYGKTRIAVLEQKIIKTDNKTAKLLEVNENDEVIYRVVSIRKENLPLVHAESYIPLKRLSKDLKEELLASKEAIGRILKKQNAEIRREVLTMDVESLQLCRTYKIISREKTLMWIKEIFSSNIV